VAAQEASRASGWAAGESGSGVDRHAEPRFGSGLPLFYDDLGQSIPDPGLVRLGVLDSGLDAIDSAGNRFTVQLDLATHQVLISQPIRT